ncbi:ABC transporter, permease and ATP-binding protein [Alteracholeplasma palmae J233]|uniref:ABC transporter, permease and ATP-binding protein n=1 Tax=Alteracholeplasma palmae (strain ATCC 49389 / J233) TaxID=1318466 RepID=U4KLQ3_ALTPJ|nr:ABC transporter ATP-binding protein [Alteracholeplasma palmae]CCV64828.1 ABC transporter, permease and ATP-binding protein [Alteracholeplasma palmae J233]
MDSMKYIKYKKEFFLGFFFKIIEVGFELFLPIFMAILMKDGLKNKNYEKGFLMAGLILVFCVLGYLSTVYAHRLTAKVSQNYAQNLRQALFYKIQDLSIEDLEEFSSSSLTNRINTDVQQMQNGLAMTMRIASRAPFLMIGSIVALFIVSPKVALILLCSLPLLLVMLLLVMKVSIKNFKKFQNQNDKLIDVVKDNTEGARMIRAFAQVEHEENRFHKKNETLSLILVKLGKLTSFSTPFTMLAMNIVLVAMIYVGSKDVYNNSMQQEQLIQIINYVTQLTLSIVSVMNLMMLYTKAGTASIRIKEILDKEPTVINMNNEKLDSTPAKIEFRDVSYTYKNHLQPTLNHINFTILPGQTIGIVGLTGSGKTTLVDLLLRFYNTTTGEILINDKKIESYDLFDLRDKIAYASQKASLLSGNVEKNIKMKNEYTNIKINEALNEAQANFILNDSEGISKTVNKQGNNFSGGQKQRLALTRALVKESSILILDDVFSALDYVTDYKIRKQLDSKENKPTTILISQRLSSLMKADKIIVIDNATIAAIDTHENLLKNNELYKKLYETQIQGGQES